MSKPMVQGAIFDMDGTLLDSMPVWEHAGERYLEKQGIRAGEGLSAKLFSMSMKEGAAYMKSEYGLSEETDQIISGINDLVFLSYQHIVMPKDGIGEQLDRLRAYGVPMAVATSTDRAMAEVALGRTGLLSYFKRIVTCSEVGAGKTSPAVYEEARQCLGCGRDGTYVFEDALYAIRTARAAGYRTVGIYDDGSRMDQAAIRAEADLYLRRWDELAGLLPIKKLSVP